MASVKPRYILDKNWGVKVDQHNWTLVYKSDASKTWNVIGYYVSPETLLKGLFRSLQKEDMGKSTLVDQLTAAAQKAEKLSEKFREFLVKEDIPTV